MWQEAFEDREVAVGGRHVTAAVPHWSEQAMEGQIGETVYDVMNK